MLRFGSTHHTLACPLLFTLQTLAPVVGPEIIGSAMLPVVLKMANDAVPNIRFNVAKTLKVRSTAPPHVSLPLGPHCSAPCLYCNDLKSGRHCSAEI